MENHFRKYSLFQEEGFETSKLINYWKRGKRTNQTKHTKTEQRFCLLLFNMALSCSTMGSMSISWIPLFLETWVKHRFLNPCLEVWKTKRWNLPFIRLLAKHASQAHKIQNLKKHTTLLRNDKIGVLNNRLLFLVLINVADEKAKDHQGLEATFQIQQLNL